MSKRHRIAEGDWELIVKRLEELVLANSGEDEFEEIFKLLVAKIVSEMDKSTAPAFRAYEEPGATKLAIDRLLARAEVLWPGILDEANQSLLTDSHLQVCVAAIAPLVLLDSNIEILDAMFEYLVSRSAKGAKGQFFTPRTVIECCVRIVKPKANELIADPACGSGGFLVHAASYVAEHEGIPIKKYVQKNLWGFEIDGRAARIARAMLLLAARSPANIYRLNSLQVERTRDVDLFAENGGGSLLGVDTVMRARAKSFKGFDAIMTNPPFAGEVRERSLLAAYQLALGRSRVERDVLFIERCVELLKPGGRFCMVVPHNKLGAPSFTYVRQWLLRNVRVVAVLGLDRQTFLPHTHQKAGVIFGVKRRHALRGEPAGREECLFVVSERSGKDGSGKTIWKAGKSKGGLWESADHDLDQVVELVERFVVDHGISW